jgi:creatinine amidohydrolase
MSSVHLEQLTWPDVKAVLENGFTTVIIPVGSTEQHGPHLPLSTDSLHTLAMLEEVARRLQALLAPLVPIGCSDHHLAFPGTLSVTRQTLGYVIRDYCHSLMRHGFRNILIYSGHGGNAEPLASIIADVQRELPSTRIIGCTDWSIYENTLLQHAAVMGIDATIAGGHSGELEASMMLAIRPELVHMERAAPGYLGEPGSMRSKVFAEGIQAVSPNGVLGDPRAADAGRGRMYVEAMVDRLTEYFQSALGANASS